MQLAMVQKILIKFSANFMFFITFIKHALAQYYCLLLIAKCH